VCKTRNSHEDDATINVICGQLAALLLIHAELILLVAFRAKKSREIEQRGLELACILAKIGEKSFLSNCYVRRRLLRDKRCYF